MQFEGIALFEKHVSDALQNIKTDIDTAKSLGALQYHRPGLTTFCGS